MARTEVESKFGFGQVLMGAEQMTLPSGYPNREQRYLPDWGM